MHPEPAADWEKLRPVLDEVMDELDARDREAVLLRFFEDRPFAAVAAALRVSEEAARKRVDRALDKLGALLSRRLPDFFQLDLRVDRAWHHPWGTAGVLNLYIDLQNVLNRKNAEGVTYSEDYAQLHYTNGLPIFPSIGVEYIP